MQAGFRRTTATLVLVCASSAQAYGPPLVPIQVDNDAGAQIEVWVDGTWRGSVVAATERAFTTLPGQHTVQATLRDGTTLLSTALVVTPGRPAFVQVLPPVATLVLSNDGHAPLWVEIPGVAPFWSLPGTDAPVQVPVAPAVPVQTSIYGRYGLVPVGNVAVATRPGQRMALEIGWTAPPPVSTVTLTNQEDHIVRVYIAGAEVAVIPPGQTRQWDVSPGRFPVLVVEQGDGVVFDQLVTFDPRRDHQLVVTTGVGRWVAPGGRPSR